MVGDDREVRIRRLLFRCGKSTCGQNLRHYPCIISMVATTEGDRCTKYLPTTNRKTQGMLSHVLADPFPIQLLVVIVFTSE